MRWCNLFIFLYYKGRGEKGDKGDSGDGSQYIPIPGPPGPPGMTLYLHSK